MGGGGGVPGSAPVTGGGMGTSKHFEILYCMVMSS